MALEPVDYGLAALLLTLTVAALFSAHLGRAIMSFIGAGLVAALVWARLTAPDIAIAEAAIGAGVTGALLIVTWRRLGEPLAPVEGPALLVGIGVAVSTLFAGGLLLLAERFAVDGLGGLVRAELTQSGVGNPVTAVLLNYRSFDTLMEIAVLFLTLIAVKTLRLGLPTETAVPHPALAALLRLAGPGAVVFGGYVLWAGADMPGGAFQAGAIWAGALVLMHVCGVLPRFGSWLPGAATWGLGVFVAAALASYALSGVVLAYAVLPPGLWILVIEVFAALSIAVTLFVLFAPNRLEAAR